MRKNAFAWPKTASCSDIFLSFQLTWTCRHRSFWSPVPTGVKSPCTHSLWDAAERVSGHVPLSASSVFYIFSRSVWAEHDPLGRMFVMSGGKGVRKSATSLCWTPLHTYIHTHTLWPPAVGITRCPSCYCRGWSAPGWWPCAFSTVSWFSRRLNLGPAACCTRRRPRYPSSLSSSRSPSRASSWPWPFLPRVSSAI